MNDCETLLPEQPPSGRLWVPMVILAALFCLGLIVYLLTGSAVGTDPGMPWFSVRNGELYFDESLYTGSSELAVPETVGGQTVTALSYGCFYDCDSLTTVFLPETVTEIGSRAFAGCDNLRGILLPAAVTRIGAEAFYGCAALEAVSLAENVQSIGKDAFTGCNRLCYLFYNSLMDRWIALYPQEIGPETRIYTKDGILYPGNSN